MQLTQEEFAAEIKRLLEEIGFTRVKVSRALFAKKADITARDQNGKKRSLKATVVSKKGKTYIQINDPNSLDWITMRKRLSQCRKRNMIQMKIKSLEKKQ